MDKNREKIQKRIRRHNRVTSAIIGKTTRPRLAVFRAHQHIYAQIIDDASQKTLVQASSLEMKATAKKTGEKAPAAEKGSGKVSVASKVGAAIAQKALEKKITEVVFDRGGYRYHGRVKALAEAAREAGLKF